MAELRRQEPGFSLYRGVGVLEVGQVKHRLTEDFKIGILVTDRRRFLVVDDARRADAPQRRRVAIAFAWREFAVLELGDVAFAPRRALGRNFCVVLGHDRQRLHEAVAEIVGQRVAVGANNVALRLLERDVSDGRQCAGALVVDHLIGRQDVIVVEYFDVAARNDAFARRVVDELIALHIHRQSVVELLLDGAEHAAFLTGERTWRLCGRDDIGILGEGNGRERKKRSERTHKRKRTRRPGRHLAPSPLA